MLENVSHENEENCNYLIVYGRAGGEEGEEFLEVLQTFFKLLDEEVQLNPTTDMADRFAERRQFLYDLHLKHPFPAERRLAVC